MTVKDVPHDNWNEFQDPISRFAIAEIYREQSWEPTVVSEQCERTGVWPVLFHRAMAARLTAYDAAIFVRVYDLAVIGHDIAGPGQPHLLGYWRTLDISRCDIRRVVEAIEETPDATLDAAYKGDDYAERSAAKAAWLKSLAAVAKERVTFEALDSSRFYSVAVGEETRLFFIDAEDASVERHRGRQLRPGDSLKLNANDLLADYTVSVEDVPEPEAKTDTTDTE